MGCFELTQTDPLATHTEPKSAVLRSLCCQVAGPREGFPAKGALKNELAPRPTTSPHVRPSRAPAHSFARELCRASLATTFARSAGCLALLQNPTGRIRLDQPKCSRTFALLCVRHCVRIIQKTKGAGGLDVIRKEAWPCYRTNSGVRLCWVSKNLKDQEKDLKALCTKRRANAHSPLLSAKSRGRPRKLLEVL